ncbi:hypothetical protein NQ314_016204 [Rhamnusium bicolor]|uniref:C2H2-type domain-containing protein n=1 Tax=Rhamnusium bicolor TaxID=1586634 RepID=A0AAV8WWG1_9CUCU|nr:hypothetical protein NQ314_016204 [Rhamnusium bicolor]
MTEFCLICLKNENYLIKIVGKSASNEDVLDKLKKCVPEIEWNLCFKICTYCIDDLNKAYDFKELCINSYNSWRNSTPYVKSEVLEDRTGANELSSDNDNDTISLENDLNFFEEEKSKDNSLFECFDCKKEFKAKSVLESHIQQVHKKGKRILKKKNVSCKFCGKMYTTHNAMQKHLKMCRKKINDTNIEVENLEKGTNCNQNISNNNIENLEIVNGVKSDEVDLKIPPMCSLCGTTFCNKYLLKRHLQNVHATEKRFKCDLYHAGDRSHICSFCGKGFITASDLYHHEKIHANKRAYRCEICPKAFNTSSDLHKHKICVHLDRSEWKYVCTYCQRRFPLKTNLDTHVKTHTGEKNYPCHLCDRRCINKSVLMRHIETHSNVIAFKCNLCMQGYKYRKSLDVHMAKIHGIGNIKIPERIKKFFCHLCPKSYFANNKLQKHIRSHSGERPFQCSNCEKSFVDKSYIKQHLKTAHNIININKLEF